MNQRDIHWAWLPMIALATVALGCVHRPTFDAKPTFEAKPVPPGDHLAAREQVRSFAKTYCGACHQASLPTAKPAALAIFNLDAEDWSSTLTTERLTGGFSRRLNARLDAAGRQQLRAFVEGELARRED
jgi:mono/diheme cytochrome c family protein